MNRIDQNAVRKDNDLHGKYITVRTLELAGFAGTLQALRLPFGKECRSKVNTGYTADGNQVESYSNCDIAEKDVKLISTLVKNGDEHAKAVRGLMVWAEIYAPRYFWVEMDTYVVGSSPLSSESTMHIQGKGLNTEELVAMKNKLEEGTMQKRVRTFSYQTLRRIYFQRRNHRLPHWHEFCDWIKSLPYADEWIICKRQTSEQE